VPQETRAPLKTGWYLLGPAFVAAIAYVDPGNVAANVTAGAQFGFTLLWVIVIAKRDGRSCAIPVGEARAGDRAFAAGSNRSAAEPPGPAGLLGAGRDRRDGHRRGRGDRRCHSLYTFCSTCRCWSAG